MTQAEARREDLAEAPRPLQERVVIRSHSER